MNQQTKKVSPSEMSSEDSCRKSGRDRKGTAKLCGECDADLTSADYSKSRTLCTHCFDAKQILDAKKEIKEYIKKSKS